MMVCLFIVDATGKLIWLAKSEFPVRTPEHAAIDVVIDAAIIIWIVVLITKEFL